MKVGRRWMVLVSLLLVSTAGCGGAMGQVSSQDKGASDKGGILSSLDAPLAVGGTVRPSLRVEVQGSTPPPVHLVSARPDIVDVVNGNLVGRRAGMAAVLVATDAEVLDFVHVWVTPMERVEVHILEPNGSEGGVVMEPVEMVIGESIRLVPHAYSANEALVGVQTSSWTVEPPIAQVLREGLPGRVRLVARTAGIAKVRVAMLDKSSTIDLKVLP